MSNQAAYNRALELIRDGRKSNLEIVWELEGMLGVDHPHRIVAQAQNYWSELKAQAFDAAVDAAGRGEDRLAISKKLVELGFFPYDADVFTNRAIAEAHNAADEGEKPEE